jgi:hypothetical protein
MRVCIFGVVRTLLRSLGKFGEVGELVKWKPGWEYGPRRVEMLAIDMTRRDRCRA